MDKKKIEKYIDKTLFFIKSRSKKFWFLFIANFLLYSTPPIGLLFSLCWWFSVTDRISKKRKKIISYSLIGFLIFITAIFSYAYSKETKPTIEIDSVSNNQVVQSPNIRIQGKYYPYDVRFYINGEQIKSENGQIDYQLALEVGENKIRIVAANLKLTEEDITIIRELSPEEIARKEAELESLRKEEEERLRLEAEQKESEELASLPSPTLLPTPAPIVSLKEESVVPTSNPIEYEKITVSRVVDGDTIELSNGKKVRYIGINTPETVNPNTDVQCMGKEASAKNKELVLGKEVRLEKDVSETDRYGRLLRYVYVGDLFINDYLVRQGYAEASAYPPDVKYQSQFNQAETEARDNNRGLWSGVCETYSAPTYQPIASPATTSNTGSCKYSCSGPDRDCADFSTHAEAVQFFNCCGFTATNDPMKLDSVGVGDGDPCESRP